MGFGVFIHRADSIYDDDPAEQYQFPSQYLGRVQACIGDWIIYYEPRKVADTRGYFAVAKVQQVIPDPKTAGMHLALMVPGSFLEFVAPVPFSDTDGLVERGLLNPEGRISGRAQSAVRPISSSDFNRIISLGFNEDEPELPRLDADRANFAEFGLADGEQAPFIFDQERARIVQLTSRAARDKLFRAHVLRAYAKRCAITGLKLINGGGRAEVDAAHIKPVEKNGPDSIRNGIALSGTAHWMFDRGLVSIADDFEILISRQVNDPDSVRSLINKTGRAIVPHRLLERPHPRFLQWHRENCFKL